MSSRNWLRFDSPDFVIAHHYIDDGQQFSHASNNSNLLKFVSRDESLIEGFDNWIKTNGSQGSHIELGADLSSAGKDVPSAALFATVTIERRDAS